MTTFREDFSGGVYSIRICAEQLENNTQTFKSVTWFIFHFKTTILHILWQKCEVIIHQ
jgi:hypothetical protein